MHAKIGRYEDRILCIHIIHWFFFQEILVIRTHVRTQGRVRGSTAGDINVLVFLSGGARIVKRVSCVGGREEKRKEGEGKQKIAALEQYSTP